MAAVTIGSLRPSLVAGYEVNDRGQAATAIVRGDLLIITATAPGPGFTKVWAKATAGVLEAHGIALKSAAAGRIVDVGIQGEMEGYTGLTPGAPLYPSASVAGGLDTTATATPITRVRAITTTGIRYSFV
jgi:hypothetical protein